MLQAEGARPAKEQRRHAPGAPGNEKNVSVTSSPKTRLQTSMGGQWAMGRRVGFALRARRSQ